jgi:hypothetical protein
MTRLKEPTMSSIPPPAEPRITTDAPPPGVAPVGSAPPPADSRRFTRYVVLGLAGAAVLLVGLIILTLTGFGRQHGQENNADDDDSLDGARAELDHDADLAACRDALQKVNVHISRDASRRPPEMPAERRDALKKFLGVSDDELSEAASQAYTPLDGQQLEQAFLLRDVVLRTLTPERPGAVKADPLDRASAAFAWTVRQVRLTDGARPDLNPPPNAEPVTPPTFVLRRGSGTALERALVFLALLDQLDDGDDAGPRLRGCLVGVPEDPKEPDKAVRLWACGVQVGDGRDLYLFDPCLGLPVPGAGGQGTATLAAAAAGPDVHTQFDSDKEHPYDVTAAHAKAAGLYVVCPLPAPAPRLQHLQEALLTPAVRVRLYQDPTKDESELKRTVDDPSRVRAWRDGPGLLRRFLPPEEGGVDKGEVFPLARLRGFTDPNDRQLSRLGRAELLKLRLPPWEVMPNVFRDPNQFPYNVPLGQFVRNILRGAWNHLYFDVKGPRDLLLRGKFEEAAAELTGDDAKWRDFRRRFESATGLDDQVKKWVDQAVPAYAAQVRAQEKGSAAEKAAAGHAVEEVMKQVEPVYILLTGSAAVPMTSDLAFQMGLTKHEKAGRLQAGIDQARRDGKAPTDAEKAAARAARAAWDEALFTWKKYLDDFSDEDKEKPETRPYRAAMARRLRGQALAERARLEAADDPAAARRDRQAAAEAWEDPAGPQFPLERLAALYLARQMRKELGAGK